MSRRDSLMAAVNFGRFSILWLRVQLGRPLPAMLTGFLAWLDRAALRVQRGRR